VCKPQRSYTKLPKNTHQVGDILSLLTTKSTKNFKSSKSSESLQPTQYDCARYPPAGLDFFASCYTRTAADLVQVSAPDIDQQQMLTCHSMNSCPSTGTLGN